MGTNNMKLEFSSASENENFARVAVAAFITRLDPTLEEISDIKTAVSEAVTNCIVHGYEQNEGQIYIDCFIEDNNVTVIIEDTGFGIEDIDMARQPLFTTKPELERSGMGFSFMEAFMDSLEVKSKKGHGTKVIMTKRIGKGK